jgi:hypothetical protein
MSCKSRIEMRAAPSCAGLAPASISFSKRVFAKQMDCRVTPRAALALALVVASMLSACSDIYYDRRETVALGADDHIASNRVAQMIDPWPPYVGNKNLAFNGDRMQAAADRYRRNCVIPPYPLGTTVLAVQQQGVQASAAGCLPAGTSQTTSSSQGTNSQWSSQTTTQYAPPPVASK